MIFALFVVSPSFYGCEGRWLMVYPTLTLHLLISAPNDVPVKDMAGIR